MQQPRIDHAAGNTVKARQLHFCALGTAGDRINARDIIADRESRPRCLRVPTLPAVAWLLHGDPVADRTVEAARLHDQPRDHHAQHRREDARGTLHDNEPPAAVLHAQRPPRLLGVSHQRHRTRGGIFLRIAVLDQRFGVVFDVTGELISQIVRLVSRQAADLREHAVAIFLSVHSLTLFYAKCSTAFTAPEYSRQDASSSVSAARPARVR